MTHWRWVCEYLSDLEEEVFESVVEQSHGPGLLEVSVEVLDQALFKSNNSRNWIWFALTSQ